MIKKTNKVYLEDVQITYKNFKGMPTQFNPVGKKVFSVILDDEQAEMLRGYGFSIRVQAGDPERELPPRNLLEVKINYRENVSSAMNPRVVMIKSESRQATDLDADTVGVLDHLRVLICDIAISPYNTNVAGVSRVTAYLDHMYAVVEESPLDRKYETEFKPDFEYEEDGEL